MGHGLVEFSAVPILALLPLCAASVAQETAPRWVVAERRISQCGTDWKLAYQLRYTGSATLLLGPDPIRFAYQAVVSNARCPFHGFPHSVTLTLEGSKSLAGRVDVIRAEDQGSSCREHVSVELALGESPSPGFERPARFLKAALTNPPTTSGDPPGARQLPLDGIELRPGDLLSVVVVLKHEHRGCRDPLLGTRHVQWHLGPATFEDEVPLDRPHKHPVVSKTVLTPDESRCDHQTFHSSPSSLRLHDVQPRDRAYAFRSIPVSHASTVSVSFWYCVPPGSGGTCHARVVEYEDHDPGWIRLGGGFDEALPAHGRWTRFERQWTVLSSATTLTLDFRVSGGKGAEAWIDDVEILPVTPVDPGR